eukprot:Pgem_evm1s8797
MQQRTFMGCYTKCFVFYKEPWWRKMNYSGDSVNIDTSVEYPVRATFDYCQDLPNNNDNNKMDNSNNNNYKMNSSKNRNEYNNGNNNGIHNSNSIANSKDRN